MVSEAPSLAPMLEGVGGRHSRKEPWGRGMIPGRVPEGWSILGPALPALPVAAAALQSRAGSPSSGAASFMVSSSGEGSPAMPPNQLLWVTLPCVGCASAPPSAAQKLLCCAVLKSWGGTLRAPASVSFLSIPLTTSSGSCWKQHQKKAFT